MGSIVRRVFRYGLIPLAFADACWGFLQILDTGGGIVWLFLGPAASAFLAGLLYGHDYARVVGGAVLPAFALVTLGIPGVAGPVVAAGNAVGFVLLLLVSPIEPDERPEALDEQNAHKIGTV